jgi:hypothetical protein
MAKSSSEILREYAALIAEADNQPSIQGDGDPNDLGIDLPDESMMDDDKDDSKFENNWDDPEIPDTNPGDPAGELANFLGTDADKINEFLKKHNLELTPVGGLANSKGNI